MRFQIFFFFKIEICGSAGVRKLLLRGIFSFPPFLFLSLFLFLLPGQGLKIYQVEKQDSRVPLFPDKFAENFFFLFAITF